MTERHQICAGDGQATRQAGTAYVEEAGFLASVDEVTRYGAGGKQPVELTGASILPSLHESGKYCFVYWLSLLLSADRHSFVTNSAATSLNVNFFGLIKLSKAFFAADHASKAMSDTNAFRSAYDATFKAFMLLAVERDLVPDFIIRRGIRYLLSQRVQEVIDMISDVLSPHLGVNRCIRVPAFAIQSAMSSVQILAIQVICKETRMTSALLGRRQEREVSKSKREGSKRL